MGKSAPKPPDPYKVADAQTQSNIGTAQAQQQIAMTGSETPYGSIQYVKDPTSPSGYRAITQLTPEMQALLGQQQNNQAAVLDNVGHAVTTPFDINAAGGAKIADMQKTFLDPVWDQKQQAMETDLLNRGIRPGSAAYQTAMTQFQNQRSQAYDQMFLDAYTTGNNAALTERNLPIADFTALNGGLSQQPAMQLPTTPAPGVAATDVEGPVQNAYNAQLQAYQSQMGGLFGLGSSLLGGWAQAGFPGLSDVRAKEDIERIGTDPRGWGVYKFRYKGAPKSNATWQVGYMAQEVERFRPDAVITSPSTGIKFVDYERLAA